jgi:hypothetical protein
MPLSRRNFLRGAGAMMALPFLESLPAARAFAAATGAVAGKPPLRMGIFTVTGGTVLESWRMKEAGPLPAKLPSILRPLEFARDDLLLVTGLSNEGKGENVNGHEHCASLHLTGAAEVKKIGGRIHAGVSVDQVAAANQQTFLPSLEMGLSNQETQYSFRSRNENVPYECNPRLVFERMFRGRKPIVPNWSRRASAAQQDVRASARSDSLDRSVVDLILGDAKDLQGKLGASDKRRLDEYLSSVRAIEQRIDRQEARQAVEAQDEKNPGPSRIEFNDHLLPPEGLDIWAIKNPVERDPDRHAEYIKLMAELMVLAFQTDTTRVSTLAVGSDSAWFPGVVTVGYERFCHTLEHQGNASRPEDADPIAREACRQIHAFYTGLFAEMVRKMKQIDEGGSSLLDNTMLLYTSYMADGGHGRRDYPVLLAGKAGGTLKTGRQVDYRKNTPQANLYVEMLDRMGVKVDEFGNSKTSSNAAYDGRLPGLL